MAAKLISGLLAFIRNPLEVYRLGWFVMASAASFYLFVIVIKAGFGPSHQVASRSAGHEDRNRPVAQASRHEGNAFQNWTGSTGNQGQFASSNGFGQHVQNDDAAVYQANVIKPKFNGGVEGQQYSFQQNLKKASVRNDTTSRKKPVRKSAQKKSNKRNAAKNKSKKDTLAQHNPFFANGYVQESNHRQHASRPRIEMVKTRTPRAEIFGVKLAKGRSISEVRKKWRKLYAKHHKKLRNLGPLIIKDNASRKYPIQLIIGPFTSPNRAVRFCAALSRHLNCNLKRYNGTPL